VTPASSRSVRFHFRVCREDLERTRVKLMNGEPILVPSLSGDEDIHNPLAT
jgi:hypothetical protein